MIGWEHSHVVLSDYASISRFENSEEDLSYTGIILVEAYSIASMLSYFKS